MPPCKGRSDSGANQLSSATAGAYPDSCIGGCYEGGGEYVAIKRAPLQSDCPPGLLEQIVTFDKAIWRSLNSFVHAGIHPLRHGQDGFPMWLAIQVLQSSNALVTMAVAMLSKLTGEDRGLDEMNRIIPTCADCLPELLPIDR